MVWGVGMACIWLAHFSSSGSTNGEGVGGVISEIATVYASASTFFGCASTFRKTTRISEYFCPVRVLFAHRTPPS